MQAQPHPRQEERLRALYSYDILDTDREKDFDDIVHLASAICGTPISVVNLIDAERQWFKAETGLGTRETPLATSICSHVILEDDFVEIHDTLEDSRMADNPLCVGEPGLRFYAGALLKSDEGLPLGTLCVLDYQRRELSPHQRDALRVLARQAMAQLEMRKALRIGKLLRQEVDHRVKNSLQSISSFIRIQSTASSSPEVKSMLDSIQSRIEAVSILHKVLYETDSGPTVDLEQYVRNLADHFATLAPDNVTVEAQADPITIASRQAAALGTLLNEFVANSFKHAFPDRRPGRVTLTVNAAPDGLVEVRCRDDGVGLPGGTAVMSGGLGMKVSQIIGAELGSELEIDTTGQGLSIGLRFRPLGRPAS